MTNLPPGVTGNEPEIAGEQHAYQCEFAEDWVVLGEMVCRENLFGDDFWIKVLCAQSLDPGATFCPRCGATRWDISLANDAMLTGWAPSERECTCDG